ncbi:MAG TPA: CoA transferase [Dehalococcoidia bacterium]|jgi:crotonobetainyl-CoA:carnitine CoA-transferase CaiB-like acyl-CoA transferase|nr:CoA transferase [Dehalococcoidia bacterium]
MVAPLSGIRVVEVSNWLAAPSAAALMADLGADVVKIEPPSGDAFRHFNMRSVGYDYDFATNPAFELDNRGKQSIVVALDRPGGPELVKRLAADADIFITNLVQHRRERYGLTVENVHAVNDGLVYVSFSGYGTDGPDADRAGFDYAAFWARSGIMGLMGEPPSSPPICRPGQGDQATALNLLASTLAALRLRDQTGEGQVVDVTLLGTGMWTIGPDLSAVLQAHQQPPRHQRTQPANPIWNPYQCSDGRWLLLVMPQPDRYWPAFCEMVERPAWVSDPRYDTLERRAEHSEELTKEIDAIFASAELEAWAQRLDAAGVIWAPVVELPEVVDDPTVRSLGSFVEIEHPQFGSYETLATPFNIRGVDISPRGPAPGLGEHTQSVLEALGLDSEELAELAAAGVFG